MKSCVLNCGPSLLVLLAILAGVTLAAFKLTICQRQTFQKCNYYTRKGSGVSFLPSGTCKSVPWNDAINSFRVMDGGCEFFRDYGCQYKLFNEVNAENSAVATVNEKFSSPKWHELRKLNEIWSPLPNQGIVELGSHLAPSLPAKRPYWEIFPFKLGRTSFASKHGYLWWLVQPNKGAHKYFDWYHMIEQPNTAGTGGQRLMRKYMI
ncbi:hypothetical protein BGX38DRAFT_1144018 [Terfezia claveryi]|nr:hypothetical protein BGX38DRAFT_1144018 [Terfezia claveryi]